MKLLRWFAVIPSAILGWYVVFTSGLLLVSAISSLCPPEEIISGLCGAWWYPYAERTVILFSVAASAFLVVVCAAVVAPANRVNIAWAAFVSGALVATYFLSQTSAVMEFVLAILAGLLGVFSVARYLGSSMLPNNRFHWATSLTRRRQ